MKTTVDLSEKENALHNLLVSQETLLLSTASINGEPDLGYAPFVRDQTGCFYVFISELAAHTANLFANPRTTVMFIRPESESRNLFARERALFQCAVREVDRDDDNYLTQLNALQTKFGEVVAVLRALSDFHLFALSPETGKYVAGFGQAYTVNLPHGTLKPLIKKHG